MTETSLYEPQTEVSDFPKEITVAPSSGDQRLVWLGGVLLSGAFIWLYIPTFLWLSAMWSSDEYYAHGPFLPFISAYLVWQKRQKLLFLWQERPLRVGFPSGLIFLALTMQVLGSMAEMRSVHALQAFSIPLFLIGAARYFGGKTFARELYFPLLFLFLAVPMSGPLIEKLTIPLQTYAASASAMVLGLLGMPIEREGVNLYTPLYHFVVAVPCSGLKIGITLFTMGVLIAQLMPNLTTWQRVGLALLSLPIALLANMLRVMTIVSLGFHFGTAVAEGFLHRWSGLFMFALALALLIGCGSYLGHASRALTARPKPL